MDLKKKKKNWHRECKVGPYKMAIGDPDVWSMFTHSQQPYLGGLMQVKVINFGPTNVPGSVVQSGIRNIFQYLHPMQI